MERTVVTKVLGNGTFSNAQIKWFLSGKKRTKSHWSKEDYTFACQLRQNSPRAATFLRKKGFPVAATNTVTRKFSWLSTLPGLLRPVIEFYKLGMYCSVLM